MKKYIIVLLHAAYWITYTLLFSFSVFAVAISGKDEHGVPWAYTKFTTDTFVFLFIFFILGPAISFYTSYFLLFSKFLQKKKIFQLIFFGALTVMASGIICAILMYIIYQWQYHRGDLAPGFVMIMCVMPGLHTLMGLLIRGFVTSYGDIRIKEDLKNKNLEMELALIKAQINPHFLFNTINNIDVLITKDAAKASLYLNKLSDILRYMLYETKTENVLFSKEVENLEKYLELQKIRTSNPDYIFFNVNAKGNPLIAPMLFMPFIENAVKYAENKKTEKAIQINFEVNNDQIIFECKNSYNEDHIVNDLKGGLGKELAIKRLKALYPEKYQLNIHDKSGIYSIKLVISL